MAIEQTEMAHPVYLISGELPGCGATTLANRIGAHLTQAAGVETHIVFVGQRVRGLLQVNSEEEMREVLATVPDPERFDPEVYENLPTDRPVIVEGKLATRVGPKYITGRPIHLVDLTVHPFQSAIRVMQREGTAYETIYQSDGQVFLNYFRDVAARAKHVADLRASDIASGGVDEDGSRIRKHRFDTGLLSPEEAAAAVLGLDDGDTLRASDLEAVADFTARLVAFSIKLNGHNLHPLDRDAFDYNTNNLRYQTQRLETNPNSVALPGLQAELRDNIIDSVFSLFMRSVPRFYTRTNTGLPEIAIDQTSQRWSPEFYKIAMAMPTLKSLLTDKTILDPFAGAGSLMFYLAAKGIPRSVICSDICYPGGKPIHDEGFNYSPTMNQQSIMALFTMLPSWCRPNFDRFHGFVTANGTRLPFTSNAVDYVVGDPPYGVNCSQGDAQVLTLALPELLRVSKEGVLSMLPEDWVPALQNSSYKVTKLTEDLSTGSSNLPTCYVLIQDPKKQMNTPEVTDLMD